MFHKSRLIQLAKEVDLRQRLNFSKEYIQGEIISIMYQGGFFDKLSFVGGTALRFVHGLKRFSEDLDFEVLDHSRIDIDELSNKIGKGMMQGNFIPNISKHYETHDDYAETKECAIVVLDVKSPSELNIQAPYIQIRVEIDQTPALGAVDSVKTIFVNNQLIAIRIQELESLMAGKIHALCCRDDRAKGRDWYDLLWYLAKRPPVKPNLLKLQNAIRQTEGEDAWDASEWNMRLAEKIKKIDIPQLAHDVSRFIENIDEVKLISSKNILNGLE